MTFVRRMMSQADLPPVPVAMYKVKFANTGLFDTHMCDIYHTVMPAAGARMSLRATSAVKRPIEPKDEPSSSNDDDYVAADADPYMVEP